jgi:hypothetical protein
MVGTRRLSYLRDYPKASVIRRATAFYIDFATLTLVPFLLFLLGTNLNGWRSIAFALFLIMFTIISFLLKDCFNGVSLGRYLMGIAVRDINNSEVIPSKKRLILRNFSMLAWPFEFLVLLFTKQRVGDRISHTEVIFLKKKRSFWKNGIIGLFTFICVIMIFVLIIAESFKHSEAYQTSINYIQQNKEIQTETNGIQGYGWFPQGSISLSNTRGSAEFEIKVIGNTKNVIAWIELSKEPLADWKVKKFLHKEIY